jgi:hypothetical protein
MMPTGELVGLIALGAYRRALKKSRNKVADSFSPTAE